MNTKMKMLVLLAALSAPSLGLASAGKVLFTLGRVDIQRAGAVIPATRGMPVQAGDQLELGPTGRTQIRMADGAMIALQPGSSFVIEEYQLPDATAAAVTAPAPVTAASSRIATPATRSSANAGGRALFSLLKGGFRTITGLIGKGGQDVYQLKTPVATIGIRGTTYSATYCAGNCKSAPNGLYVGVSSGKVVVTNNTGSLPINDNQYGFVADENAPPEKQLEPPTDVLDPPIADTDKDGDSGNVDDGAPDAGAGADGGTADGSSQGDGSSDGSDTGGGTNSSDDGATGDQFGDAGGDSGGFESPPPDQSSPPTTLTEAPPPPEVPGAEPDPTVLPTRLIAHGIGPLLTEPAFAAVSLDTNDVISLGTEGELLAFRSSTPAGVADYALGTAQNVNLGVDPATDLRWGRWSTGLAMVGADSLDLSSQSLHWIFGPETLAQPTLPITGSASYSLVGNTDPTDNFGNIGVLGSAQFSACFSCANSQSGVGTVQSSLSLGINNQVWSASGTGDIINGFPAFAGDYSSVTVNGQSGGTGSFAGFFTGPPGGGIPPGAGLGYSLNNGTTTISGAAAFGNPKGAQ